MEYVFSTPSRRWSGLPLASHRDTGKKGAGLLGIPPKWYPPTLVVSPALHRELRVNGVSRMDVATVLSSEPVRRAIQSMGEESKTGRLLARSSAVSESIRERGKYLSVECTPGLNDLSTAVHTVIENQGEDSDTDIGILLQPLLQVEMRGHLSNEHRLSRESFSWTIEIESGTSNHTQRWRVVSDEPSSDDALTARTPESLFAQLRGVAKRLAHHAVRYHLEWVWDGACLWIVQSDQITKLHAPGPGEVWKEPRADLPADGFHYWQSLDDLTADSSLLRWNKVASLMRFRECNLPSTRMWALEGARVIEDLIAGTEDPELLEELEVLSGSTVIIRTDVASDDQQLMLRKLETSDAKIAMNFLREVSRGLAALGIDPASICFLAHRYIAARACAWSLSEPGSSEVIIHSTWGLLDGLGWLPHDVFHFNINSGDFKIRSVEGKSECLDVDEDGRWAIRETPTEWIWRSSMSAGQIRLVAEGAKRLAAVEDRTILTMWFIDLLDESGVECLPWITHTNIPTLQENLVLDRLTPITVRSTSDLDDIAEKIPVGKRAILELHPGSEIVRDADLIDKVIQVAKTYALPVEIVGSPLGHPYYLLSAAGVQVTCRQSNVESPTVYGKIVRDTIPDIIERNGESAAYFKATGKRREKLFRVKVLEEAMELFRATSRDQSLDELADLEEIVAALRQEIGISKKELLTRMKEKRSRRGGFRQGIVLSHTSSGKVASVVDQPVLPGMETFDERIVSWQVRKEGNRVLINYVPPIVGHQSTFRIGIAGGEFEVKYLESHIEVERVIDIKDPGPDGLW